MLRYIFHIVASVLCLLVPIIGYIYWVWDSNQPQIGPVGNGKASPSVIQWIPLVSTFITGAVNLPLAIIRYVKHKESEKND